MDKTEANLKFSDEIFRNCVPDKFSNCFSLCASVVSATPVFYFAEESDLQKSVDKSVVGILNKKGLRVTKTSPFGDKPKKFLSILSVYKFLLQLNIDYYDDFR